MITKEDIERLIAANAEVHQLLAPGADLRARLLGGTRARRAASVLCVEFGWLVYEKGTFWEALENASQRLAEHRERETALLGQIAALVEQEQAVFHRLDIDEEGSASVIAQTYTALRNIRNYEDPSPDALRILRERLNEVQKLVCESARGPLRRAYDKVIGYQGALVLAGAAVAGADVMIAVADQGAVSWVSLKAGYHVMRGDVDGLLDILRGKA